MAHKLMLTSVLVFFPTGWQLPAGLIFACVYLSKFLHLVPDISQSVIDDDNDDTDMLDTM
jgi:hypothetical protein